MSDLEEVLDVDLMKKIVEESDEELTNSTGPTFPIINKNDDLIGGDSEIESLSDTEDEDVEPMIGGADAEDEEAIDTKSEDDEEDEDKDEEPKKDNPIDEKESTPTFMPQVTLSLDSDNNNNNSGDDDEDNDDDYLQKFDRELRNNYLVDFHPESQIHNFDEIQDLLTVVKNKDNIIIDKFHTTIPWLTKYEKTRILGQRTKQINSGAKAFVKTSKYDIDGSIIALKELQNKKLPFIIRRPLPNGGSEYWNLQDLELI